MLGNTTDNSCNNPDSPDSNESETSAVNTSAYSSTPTSAKKNRPLNTPPPSKTMFDNGTTLINDFGACLACGDEDAFDKCVSCLLCNHSFHAICKSDNGVSQNILCNKTFLEQFSKRVEKNDTFPGTFCFVCDPCLTSHEQKQAASVKAHVQTLERKVESMESNLSEIKNLLISQQHVTPSAAHSPNSPISCQDTSSVKTSPWDDAAGLKRVKSKIPVIVKSGTSGAYVPDAALEKIITENKIHVEQNFKNKSGENVLVVSSPEGRAKLTTKLQESYPDHSIFQPPERLPTISVANIIDNIPPDQLRSKYCLSVYA